VYTGDRNIRDRTVATARTSGVGGTDGLGVGVKVAGVGLSVKVAMLGVGHEVGRGVGISAGVGGAVGSMVGEGVGFVVFGVKCNGAHPIPVHLKFFPQYESVQHGMIR
jgi:hypothetical protein